MALGCALWLSASAPPALAKGRTYVIKRGGHRTTTLLGRKHKFRKIKRRRGRLRLVQLTNGDGFVVANPRRSWGTRLAVYRINWVMAHYHRRYPKASPLVILDLSKRGGGPMGNHNSHMDGRDVDLPLVLDPIDKLHPGAVRTVDEAQTWFLLRKLVSTCDVEYVFLDRAVQKQLYDHALSAGHTRRELALVFQYPRTTGVGLVRHWPNHRDHLHVRFRQERGKIAGDAKAYCDHLGRREGSGSSR